ncbi:MAG TPA: KH domain-containing protein, partial [Candidatus Hypogeohydataceae bacterium YC40]
MGQKVCPIGLRLGITENWRSQWYANKKNFGSLLVEDQMIRKHIKKNYGFAGIPIVEIDRTREEAEVILNTARPGLIIGRKGAGIDKLKE